MRRPCAASADPVNANGATCCDGRSAREDTQLGLSGQVGSMLADRTGPAHSRIAAIATISAQGRKGLQDIDAV